MMPRHRGDKTVLYSVAPVTPPTPEVTAKARRNVHESGGVDVALLLDILGLGDHDTQVRP